MIKHFGLCKNNSEKYHANHILLKPTYIRKIYYYRLTIIHFVLNILSQSETQLYLVSLMYNRGINV